MSEITGSKLHINHVPRYTYNTNHENVRRHHVRNMLQYRCKEQYIIWRDWPHTPNSMYINIGKWIESEQGLHMQTDYMMASSNGNIFHVTGPLCREFTGHRWIPHTKASDAKLWCFLWSAPWINGWVNNREAGDLRRHRAHYNVIVIKW